ncbi:prostatic steroid-binding protein C1-like [Rattus rattus]|uniref:prostatic steroid-binding protein C1-like n=1 Tax=Rattus rattus TaxID=10117 RepID=UPI0013F37AD8|nr:prostatic steroid-binding protein C1-like [Rattus rattus]
MSGKLSTMRLSPCLLIILAVCCYETNAGNVCDAVLRESATFILGSKESLRKELEQYSAPPEAVEAKLDVKQCVDQMRYGDRLKVAGVLVQILLRCGVRGWLEKYFPGIPLGN